MSELEGVRSWLGSCCAWHSACWRSALSRLPRRARWELAAGGSRCAPQDDRQGDVSVQATPSATKPHWACPTSACEAIIDPHPLLHGSHFVLPDGKVLEGGGEEGALDPADLRSAYKISASGGAGQTIAVDDEGGYPTAEADLAKYRARYGLPPCTKASGCFKAVNSKGEEANYPAPNSYWEPEDAIDLDMASAACPECHVMIVETSGEQEPVGAVFTSALEEETPLP